MHWNNQIGESGLILDVRQSHPIAYLKGIGKISKIIPLGVDKGELTLGYVVKISPDIDISGTYNLEIINNIRKRKENILTGKIKEYRSEFPWNRIIITVTT